MRLGRTVQTLPEQSSCQADELRDWEESVEQNLK